MYMEQMADKNNNILSLGKPIMKFCQLMNSPLLKMDLLPKEQIISY